MNDSKPLPYTLVLAASTWVFAWAAKWLQWANDNAASVALFLAACASIATIWHGVPAGLNQWRKWWHGKD